MLQNTGFCQLRTLLISREDNIAGNLLYLLYGFNGHRLDRHIRMAARIVDRALGDPVQDLHAVSNFTENAVSVTLCPRRVRLLFLFLTGGSSRLKIQAVIIGNIEIELACGMSSSSARRAMAMVPRRFFRPLSASLRIGIMGVFSFKSDV